MGVFDALCGVSGIVLEGRTRLLLGVEESGELLPILPSLRGEYDRYGGIENIVPGAELAAAEQLAKIAGKEKLEELLSDAFEPGLSYGNRRLRYALVDDLVYRSVIATVASGGVEAGAESEIAAMGFEDLVLRACGAQQGSLELLRAGAKDDGLRNELEQLALFRSWSLPLRAMTVDSSAGQYLYYREEVAQARGELAAETHLKEARKRFADYPLVLAALRENELAWLEREKANLEV